MRIARAATLALLAACVTPDDKLVYQCEADGGCGRPGYVCVRPDGICRAGGTAGGSTAGGNTAGGSAAGGNTAGGAVPCPLDEPDPSGVDCNFDGIDGQLDASVFVHPTGVDGGPGQGSATDPFTTIRAALATGRPQVLLAAGTYPELVTLDAGVGLFGGYRWVGGSAWPRDGGNAVLSAGLRARNLTSATTLDRLEIQAGGLGTSVADPASIAVVLENTGSHVRVRDSVLRAGHGLPGAPGLDGGPGATGAEGVAAGAAVGDPTEGGQGGQSTCALTPAANAAGTVGGHGGTQTYGGRGQDGGDNPPLLGGQGGAGCANCVGPAGNGANGADGLAGNDGLSGADVASPGGAISGGTVVPGVGGPGQLGTAGVGATGGGGGGSIFMSGGTPGGGGGGGAAGCPGSPGTGGTSGGAAVCLLLVDSRPALAGVWLIGGTGGDGAPGGSGGPGGAGGRGGAGAPGSGVDAADGGTGGTGGRGGNGGRGGHGAGGASVGIWCSGSSAAPDGGYAWDAGLGGNAPLVRGLVREHLCP